jgi:hypothetical protein
MAFPDDPIVVVVAVSKIFNRLGILQMLVVRLRVVSQNVGSGLPIAVRWRCVDR